MSKRITGLIAIAAATILGVGQSAAAQDPRIADHHERPHHLFLIGKPHRAVEDAVQGAMRRLSMPRCQQLFEEFTDQGGRALTMNLAVTAKSPADFLAGLYFVEGDDTIQCRAHEGVAAFTEPGGRVIHVCGQRFLQFGLTKTGEILLIHELLHTLGLGENPPTSARITNAVMNRCG
jgi:hypothetical protein